MKYTSEDLKRRTEELDAKAKEEDVRIYHETVYAIKVKIIKDINEYMENKTLKSPKAYIEVFDIDVASCNIDDSVKTHIYNWGRQHGFTIVYVEAKDQTTMFPYGFKVIW